MPSPTENPLVSLRTAIACHTRDMSSHHKDAWIWGIVCGWDETLDEIAEQHGWNRETVARLKRLRSRYEKIEDSCT